MGVAREEDVNWDRHVGPATRLTPRMKDFHKRFPNLKIQRTHVNTGQRAPSGKPLELQIISSVLQIRKLRFQSS